MNKQEFEQAKQLERRIFELKLLHEYLKAFLNLQPFSIEIKTNCFDQEGKQIFHNINGKGETSHRYLQERLDAEFILECVQQRLDELNKQFEEM